MSKRTVFGRRHFDCGGTKWKVEMRDSGLYLRQHKTRSEWRVPFTYLLRFCKQQLEIFDASTSDRTDRQEIQPPHHD